MIPNPPFHIQQSATFVIAAASGGKVALGEIDGPVGAFHRIIAGLRGLSDDVVVTGQGGERHELGGTVMHAHMGMSETYAAEFNPNPIIATNILFCTEVKIT